MNTSKLIIILSIAFSFVITTGEAFAKKGRKNDGKPRVNAKAYIVSSLSGSRVYLEKDADKVRSIASLSKVMASLVIAEQGVKLDERTKMTSYDWKIAAGGCRTRLKQNVSYSNADLLHAALLGSDNRAIPALGRAVGYNAESLVTAMNARAKAMGLKSTHYNDPTGIDHQNVSTPAEMVKILNAAATNGILSKVMKKVTYTIVEEKTKRNIVYYNTNILTRETRHPVIAGKTGFNSSAGYCLATVVDVKGIGPVAFVLLGSSGMYARFSDFKVLMKAFEDKVGPEIAEREARAQAARAAALKKSQNARIKVAASSGSPKGRDLPRKRPNPNFPTKKVSHKNASKSSR